MLAHLVLIIIIKFNSTMIMTLCCMKIAEMHSVITELVQNMMMELHYIIKSDFQIVLCYVYGIVSLA